MSLFSSRFSRVVAFAAIAITSIFISRAAFACGASTGGVAGLSACSVDEHEEQIRSKWHVGAAYSYTSTAIRFTDVRPDETRFSSVATLDAIPFPRLVVQVAAGVINSQTMTIPGAKYNAPDGGVLMAVGGSYRLLDANGARPFLLATLGLTFSASQTELEGGARTRALYDAFDMRVGGVVGWNIAHVLTPYVLGRAFGGPVYWNYLNQKETGTDVYHYQLGAGLGLTFRSGFDIFVEGVPLGELGFSGGIGFSF